MKLFVSAGVSVLFIVTTSSYPSTHTLYTPSEGTSKVVLEFAGIVTLSE